jgi:hypothetical protein
MGGKSIFEEFRLHNFDGKVEYFLDFFPEMDAFIRVFLEKKNWSDAPLPW